MRHIMIPDAQVKDGVPVHHLLAAGKLIAEEEPEVVVVIGDFWDFPSLGSHSDRGNIDFHNALYTQDFEAGCEGMELLLKPLRAKQARQKANRKTIYKPRLVFTEGNHEWRRVRLEDNTPKLKGALATPNEFLIKQGFEFYDFKVPIKIDGINYCHLCPQTSSAGNIGRAHLIANRRHESWTVGHTQILDYYITPHFPRLQCLMAGAFYLHDEAYKKGSNDHWRGLVVKDAVKDGTYNPYFYEIQTLIDDYL